MKSRAPWTSTTSSAACGASTTQSANSGSVPFPGFSSETRRPAPSGWSTRRSWIASAAVARELGDAQRELRVRDDVRVRRVRMAGAREHLADAPLHLRPVARDQLGARNALRRILGMEVEREPGDRGAVPAPEALGRGLA